MKSHVSLSFLRGGRRATRRREAGVALIVSLVVLVIISLLGLSSIRGTAQQERMSANLYDREVTFQASETALRAAEVAVANSSDIAVLGGVDCRSNAPVPVTCPLVPANTWTADTTNWIDVPLEFQVNSGTLDSVAQYHIAWSGQEFGASEDVLSQASSANSAQYGESGALQSGTVTDVYRVTVRSRDDAAGGRSVVVLQTTVRVRN